MSYLEQGLRGVYNIVITPFSTDGTIDVGSLRRLVEATIARGVNGLTVLGVAGEAHKLNAVERQTVVSVAMEAAAGRLPVLVGASGDTVERTVAAATAAREIGAAGLMVAPNRSIAVGEPMRDFYLRISEAAEIPIVLQDYPDFTGVQMSPAEMAEMLEKVPGISTIKLEGTPTPQRIAETKPLLPAGRTILGGLGGIYFLDELRRGADGTMTGFAYPEILLEIWQSWQSGDRQQAADVYYRYLPLLVFEGQAKIGVAVRKEILRRRGFISFAGVRQPALPLNPQILDDLSEVLQRMGVRATYD